MRSARIITLIVWVVIPCVSTVAASQPKATPATISHVEDCIQAVTEPEEFTPTFWTSLLEDLKRALRNSDATERDQLRHAQLILIDVRSKMLALQSYLTWFNKDPSEGLWMRIQAMLPKMLQEVSNVSDHLRHELGASKFSEQPTFQKLLTGLEGKRYFTICNLQGAQPTTPSEHERLKELTARLDQQLKDLDTAIAGIGEYLRSSRN